ncbi:hypothetical protein C8T65DRAFT_737295 [Cerioporus squamosus]|nr:hypothetical protein C8T65DRAFT_737295 [Cerioporus squamosus]
MEFTHSFPNHTDEAQEEELRLLFEFTNHFEIYGLPHPTQRPPQASTSAGLFGASTSRHNEPPQCPVSAPVRRSERIRTTRKHEDLGEDEEEAGPSSRSKRVRRDAAPIKASSSRTNKKRRVGRSNTATKDARPAAPTRAPRKTLSEAAPFMRHHSYGQAESPLVDIEHWRHAYAKAGVDKGNDKVLTCASPGCEYKGKYTLLERHFIAKHLCIVLQCPVCAYAQSRTDEFWDHMKKVHPDFKVGSK